MTDKAKIDDFSVSLKESTSFRKYCRSQGVYFAQTKRPDKTSEDFDRQQGTNPGIPPDPIPHCRLQYSPNMLQASIHPLNPQYIV